MKIKAIIHSAEEGGYWAEAPELVGCMTEGDSMEEVMANLKDAIVGWLEVANNRKVRNLHNTDAMEAINTDTMEAINADTMEAMVNSSDAINSTDRVVEIAL